MMTLSRSRSRTRARVLSLANKVAVATNSVVVETEASEAATDRAAAILSLEREEALASSREAVTRAKDSDVVAADSRNVEELLAFKG